MATLKQKKLARGIVEALGAKDVPNAKDLLVSAGYDETTALSSPGRTIEQKGVQKELKKLGFTVEGADSVVQKIMYHGKKEENRLKASDMVYKRLGAYEDGGGDKTLVLIVSGESAIRYGFRPNKDTKDSSIRPA